MMIKENTKPNTTSRTLAAEQSRSIGQVKPGYKKTAIGIIPEDWEVKKFKDVFSQLRTYTFSRNELTYEKNNENLYNIHYGDIHATFPKNILDTEKNLDLIPIIINPKIETPVLLQEGDLIMADASEDYEGVGQSVELINIGKKKIVSGTHTFALRPIIDFATKYAGYIFSAFQIHKALKKIATGISVYGLSKSNISQIKLPIPPIAEQKFIADCLYTWDKGIEKLTQLIAAKKQQKKGLMQQLLTGTLRVTSASGEKFDGEWKEVRLRDYFKERNEKGFDDLELLSIGEEGVYPQSMSNKKDTSNADKSKYKLIEKGDIGYNTMRLWQGRLALSSLRGIVSPAYTIVVPLKDKANPKFFSYFFKMPFVVFKFYRNSQGMVSDTLQCRYKDFKNVKVKIPSFKEQTAIAKILQSADKEIELLEQKLSALQEQKKGLMQVLLTGEKRLV